MCLAYIYIYILYIYIYIDPRIVRPKIACPRPIRMSRFSQMIVSLCPPVWPLSASPKQPRKHPVTSPHYSSLHHLIVPMFRFKASHVPQWNCTNKSFPFRYFPMSSSSCFCRPCTFEHAGMAIWPCENTYTSHSA